MNKKYRVAFVCVHNSCRSQMAEALGKQLASEVFECFRRHSLEGPNQSGCRAHYEGALRH